MPSMIFVCTANQIRSPFASAVFQKILCEKGYPLNEWSVESAGTWVTPNLPVENRMLTIAAELQIEVSAHQKVQINEALVRDLDLIIVMEKGQTEAICYEFPKYEYKVFLLTEFGGPSYSIPDPNGMSFKNYRKVLVDLASIIAENFYVICNTAINLSNKSILY